MSSAPSLGQCEGHGYVAAGEAIISATQQADVADSLIANSSLKLTLRCDHQKDVEFSSKLFNTDCPLAMGRQRPCRSEACRSEA